MIHKSAIIDPNSQISSNVHIGPFTVIGPDVEIGEGTIIQSHVNITGHTVIGKKNKIFPFASIGNIPQDLKYNGEKTKLIIGEPQLGQNPLLTFVPSFPITEKTL